MEYLISNITISFVADNLSRTSNLEHVTLTYIVTFSIAFFLVGLTGILGNGLVIYIIFTDKKMRQSLTNMLLINLAFSDMIILTLGIPEIVQFMLNKGWLMADILCPIQRSLLVVGLYVSVMTLVALCIER